MYDELQMYFAPKLDEKKPSGGEKKKEGGH